MSPSIPRGFDVAVRTTPAKRYLARKRGRQPNAILPLTYELDSRRLTAEHYLFADDSRALRLTEELVRRLTDEFPPDVLPDGFCGATAVPSDWYSLLNVSGSGMDPLPIPIFDNATFIKANGLESALRESDRPWLHELIRLFHQAAAPCDLTIRKEASTSFPYFQKDPQYKKLAALKALRECESFLKLGCSDTEAGLKEFMLEFHALYLFAIHKRSQPNAVRRDPKTGEFSSKPRTAPTEEEARTGAYAGTTFADMTAYDRNGRPIDGHFAMRERDVFGGNGPVNYFLTAIWGCFRKVYLDRFAFTYKVRGDEDKAARLRPYKYVVGSDVKTMDKLIPRWFIDEYCARLPDYVDERVVEIFRRAYHASYVAPSPWVETPPDYSPFFGPSPFDPKGFTANVGLPSGIGPNPDIGKLWMTFNYLLVARDVGALSSPVDIEPFLQGRNPKMCLLDTADDAVFGADTESRAAALRAAKTPYAVLEPETPVIYLGGVYMRTSAGIDVVPNPVTFLVNMLCREDSIQRRGPIAWAQGYLARQIVYARTPTYRDLLAIFEESCRKHIGINPTLLARASAVHEVRSTIDAMVEADPAVLHYKVDPADVSPEVLDRVVSILPFRDFADAMSRLIKVPISKE